MPLNVIPFLLLFILSNLLNAQEKKEVIFNSKNLIIEPINGNTLIHTSILHIPNYGSFACNGMIFYENGEAVVVDTPTSDSASYELINWLRKELHCNVKAVVVSHFHEDCLGGLAAFHAEGIPSYAKELCIQLAQEDGAVQPQIAFDTLLSLKLAEKTLINYYPGPGHTKDNIVSYVPSDKVLFGGCLIKAIGAGYGNLSDADTSSWSSSVLAIKKRFPDIKYVIPGHGASGNTELLDYTFQKFNNHSSTK
jgi:metallo-beta-lactamase class B